jgi:hypothetical protein
LPFASKVNVVGDTEQLGGLTTDAPDVVCTVQVTVVNFIPASAAPPEKFTGTVTGVPTVTGFVGGETGVTTGVRTMVMEIDAGVTTPERPEVVSWIDPLIEYVGLLTVV